MNRPERVLCALILTPLCIALTAIALCASQPDYKGALDVVNCKEINGWATTPSVTIYICDATDRCIKYAIVSTIDHRPDVGAYLNDNGLHGFHLSVPDEWKDNTTRRIKVTFGDTEIELPNDLIERTGTGPWITCGKTETTNE